MAKTQSIERSTQISAPSQMIFDQIVDFRRWVKWSPWEDLDPDMERTHSGSESGPGAVYRWSGNRKAGAGSMTITNAAEPSLIDIDLQFLKPFKSQNVTTFKLDTADDATAVVWTMTMPKTVTTRLMGLFMNMDKLVGADFEKGLNQLKRLVETR